VFYVATLSKVISPGLRTAFVQCPSAAHAESMTAALRATRLMGHPLVSALASQLLLDGSAQSLLAQVRSEAHERMRMARYLLAPSLLLRAEGLHAWCRVPAPWTDATLVRTAQLQGLAIAPSMQPGIASAFTEDPIDPLKLIERPTLIIGGGRDRQVARLDFVALSAASPLAKTLWLPDMNHVLVDVTDENDDLAAYNQPERALDTVLIDSVANFILANAR